MDWQSIWTFAGTALSALFGAGLASVAYDWWRDRRSREDRAAWVALRAAIALEAFAVDCLNAAWATMDDQNDMVAPQLPVFPALPEDTEGWRSLDRRLAERVLRLPISLANAQVAIDQEVFDGDPGEGAAMYARNCAESGLEACEVAHALCKKYSFTVGDAGLLIHLRLEVAEQVEASEERDKARAKLAAEMFAPDDGAPSLP